MIDLDHVTKLIVKGKAAQERIEALASIVNTGEYTSEDVVGISAVRSCNDDRCCRHTFDLEEVMLAVAAKAKILTEDSRSRQRPYNGGQREIAGFLKAMHYAEENRSGVWRPTHL